MKITFFCHEYPPTGGGAATAVDKITACMAEQGHAIQLVTIGYGQFPEREIDSLGREIVRLEGGRKKLLSPGSMELLRAHLAFRFKSEKFVRAFSPQAIVSFFAFPAGLTAKRLAKKINLPLMVSLRGSDIPGFSDARWGMMRLFLKWVVRPAWKNADILTTGGVRLTALAQSFLPEKPVLNIPNGTDTDRFSPDPAQKAEGPLRLLYVGQLIERKRILELMDSLNNLSGQRISLTVVGDGPLRVKVMEMARSLPENVSVIVLGHQKREAMPDIYRANDVLAQISKAEGFSNVMLEGLSSGLALIVSRAVADELPIERAGFALDEVNAQSVGQCLRTLADDPVLLAEKKTNARIMAESMSWDNTAQGYIKALEKALARKA